MRPIISVENLGKEYKIGQRDAPYSTLRESLTKAARAPFSRARQAYLSARDSFSPQPPGPRPQPRGDSRPDRFWALKDVNFEIQPGEVVGIIGRNGAGKSTLLKILSRITEPTTGRVDLYGRVGSLLEVGTGFHPELTGRENIYLNGAILGMTRREIDRRFDEIVDFAEVETFIDTPVKRYSSGMYTRLAFAVAAHLELEILVVDEVLAVGDSLFQKKCLGKLGEVASQGRTVLLVSHNMAAITSLCRHGILLNRGRLEFCGSAVHATLAYSESAAFERATTWTGNAGDENLRLLKTSVRPTSTAHFNTTAEIDIAIEIQVLRPVTGLVLGLTLVSEHGYELAYCLYDDQYYDAPDTIFPGRIVKHFRIPPNSLAAGTYSIEFDVGIHMVRRIIRKDGALEFSLENTSGLGRRFPTPPARGRTGLFRPLWATASE